MGITGKGDREAEGAITLYTHTIQGAATRPINNAPPTVNVFFFVSTHPAIQREVLLAALADLKGDLKKFSYEHIEGVLEILRSDEDGLECHLPDGIRARKMTGALTLFWPGGH